MDALDTAEGTLRVLEVLHREHSISPVRLPKSHDDVLAIVGGGLQLGQHGRRRRGHVFHVLEAVAGNHVVGRGQGQTRAGLDAHDLVVEQIGVRGEFLEGVDRGVRVDRDGVARFLVPGTQVDDVIAVLVKVLGVGDGQPDVHAQVVVPLGQAEVDRSDVGVLEFDVVALIVEDSLPQV